MLPKIIFCTAVSLATLAVVLLAVLSPISHRNPSKSKGSDTKKPWLALSLYIQQPHVGSSTTQQVAPPDAGAFIFHRTLTEGPRNTSRVVGRAQGFIIPMERFSRSAFNVIYLTFDTSEYSGSLSVEAKQVGFGEEEELTVVGGTGSFAFARGVAVFARPDSDVHNIVATCHVKLHLMFPNRSQTIPAT